MLSTDICLDCLIVDIPAILCKCLKVQGNSFLYTLCPLAFLNSCVLPLHINEKALRICSKDVLVASSCWWLKGSFVIYKQTLLNPHRPVFNMALIETAQHVVKTLETCALDSATNKDLFQFMLLWWGRSYQTYYWNYLMVTQNIVLGPSRFHSRCNPSTMALAPLFFKGSTQAYFDNTSITVNKYLFPRLY